MTASVVTHTHIYINIVPVAETKNMMFGILEIQFNDLCELNPIIKVKYIHVVPHTMYVNSMTELLHKFLFDSTSIHSSDTIPDEHLLSANQHHNAFYTSKTIQLWNNILCETTEFFLYRGG